MSRLLAVSEEGNTSPSLLSSSFTCLLTASLLKRSTYNFCHKTPTSYRTEGILKSNIIEVSDIPTAGCAENYTETVPLPIAV